MEKNREMLEDVQRILDDGEQVVASIRPNKKRFVTLNVLLICLITAIPMIPCFIVGLLGALDVIRFVDETGAKDWIAPVGFLVFAGVSFLMAVAFIVSGIVRYSKTLFVITNKRLIVRSGFIGVDYKSLHLEDVTASAVRVGLLDKLCKPNTGTLLFGAASSPIYDQRNGHALAFGFFHVDDPYDLYKRVKTYLKPKGE